LDDDDEIENDSVVTKSVKINRRWKYGKIYYVIDESVKDEKLKELIFLAMKEFKTKTPIEWIERKNEPNFVRIQHSNDWEPWCNEIGCCGEQQFISMCYPTFPNSKQPITMACVLHEMLHALGFYHEHARSDRDNHVIVDKKDKCIDNEICINGVQFGVYDYRSIMHYKVNCGLGISSINRDIPMGYGNTFSEGDLAALRKIYGGKDAHFGIWHKPCSNPKCSDTICYCNSCGLLSKEFACGFEGFNKTGHWTCCFITDENNKQCNVKHCGYYHMPHDPKKNVKLENVHVNHVHLDVYIKNLKDIGVVV